MSVNFVREDTKNSLEVKLSFVIPSAILNKERESMIMKWSKEARLDGFRPGKVPVSVIKRKYELAAHQELLQKMIQDSFEDALKKENVSPVTQPKIDITKDSVGEDLVYSATFDKYPEVKLADFSKLSIKKPLSTLTDSVINEAIDSVIKHNRAYTEEDKETANGDKIEINFVGTIDGEPFPGGSAKGHSLVLGQGAMLPDFEAPLIGKRAGDTVEFPLTFPKDYHAKNLANKSVNFVVNITSVSVGKDPELNEEFYKHLNCDPCNKDGFLAAVKQPLQLQLDQQLKVLKQKRVFDVLVDKHKILLPEAMVNEELSRLEAAHKQNNPEISSKDQKKLIKQANKNVALSFILREIATENKIDVDENRVKEEIKALSGSYDDKGMFAKWYQEDEARMQTLRSQVLEDQLADWVLSSAKVTDELVDYDKLSGLIEEE